METADNSKIAIPNACKHLLPTTKHDVTINIIHRTLASNDRKMANKSEVDNTN